jgi:hypothetical protein
VSTPSEGADSESRALAERNVNPGAAHELVQRIQGIYPAGTYRAADWLLGERELSKLLDSGEDPEHLVRLTREFRAQQDAKGSTGTQFVMAPHKFFGPEGHWRGPHHLPKSQGDTVREDFLRRFGSKTGTQA